MAFLCSRLIALALLIPKVILECQIGPPSQKLRPSENVYFNERRMFTLPNIKHPKSRMCFQKTACVQLLAEMFILLNIYFTELNSTNGATWWPNVALPKYTKLDPFSFANKWLSTCVKPPQIIWVISVTF